MAAAKLELTITQVVAVGVARELGQLQVVVRGVGRKAATLADGADWLCSAAGKVAHCELAGGSLAAAVSTMKALASRLFDASVSA